jgi:hypothetical protein
MMKISELQRGLLERVHQAGKKGLVRGVEGTNDSKIEGTVTSLIKRGLLNSIAQKAGGDLLALTPEGWALFDSVELPSSTKSDSPQAPIEGGDVAESRAGLKAAGPSAPKGKLGIVVTMLRRSEGATITQLQEATGWQAHSVRGAISGAIKKKLGLTVVSQVGEAGRVYRVASVAGS